MFKIADVASGVGVGSVGFWTKGWRDERVYEVGRMAVPEFQGHRGGGNRAGNRARQGRPQAARLPERRQRASNAICRKLGFELFGACEFEFPKGHFMSCDDWRMDLHA